MPVLGIIAYTMQLQTGALFEHTLSYFASRCMLLEIGRQAARCLEVVVNRSKVDCF